MSFPKRNLRDILFIDIETAAISHGYDAMDDAMKVHWAKRAARLHRNSDIKDQTLTEALIAQYYIDKAAIYAEYARVVCISMGVLSEGEEQDMTLRIKSIYGDSEVDILQDFAQLLRQHYNDPQSCYLCGHNIREFDIPFLCRRYLANKIQMPSLLNVSGLRPWQVGYLIDTLDLWKFGDYKYYSSLDLLCHVLGIPSPKSSMTGSDVSKAFYNGQIEEIRYYCERDIVATVRLYLRCIEAPTIEDTQVVYVTE